MFAFCNFEVLNIIIYNALNNVSIQRTYSRMYNFEYKLINFPLTEQNYSWC